MPRDVGSYFDRLTARAKGGRRLDADRTVPTPDASERRDAPPRRGGGLAGTLKDVLRRGRTTTADRERRRPLPPEGVVRIEYSPRLDGDPDPGEVVWTWVPYEEDPEQGKDRPVVVIGRRGRHLVGVPLTTKQNGREAQISIGTGDWDPERRTSYARIWRMLDIDEDRTRREGAVLDRARFDAVVAAVDEYYDVRRPPPD